MVFRDEAARAIATARRVDAQRWAPDLLRSAEGAWSLALNAHSSALSDFPLPDFSTVNGLFLDAARMARRARITSDQARQYQPGL
jgi:hypothetical protein